MTNTRSLLAAGHRDKTGRWEYDEWGSRWGISSVAITLSVHSNSGRGRWFGNVDHGNGSCGSRDCCSVRLNGNRSKLIVHRLLNITPESRAWQRMAIDPDQKRQKSAPKLGDNPWKGMAPPLVAEAVPVSEQTTLEQVLLHTNPRTFFPSL